ncbi:THAP domain-containing protein 2-like isoform X2 [Coccinella septempunctata]|uniref:THAP domain-containing protein 2-like isoform X2 n=1 Tax=Coccinella septempunctata TaxID=41139 RepID=UPI001D068FCD|nr:THAP domain-containing protein 2-like isoform X2 [Coccinella septempunctata]
MVKSCAAINCTKRFKKGENIKFHKFPKDEVLRKKWLLAVRRKDFIPKDSSLICSKHFVEEDYYINVHGNKNLKVGSVPSVFDFPGKIQKKTPRRKLIRKGVEEPNVEEENGPSTSLSSSNLFKRDVTTTSVLTESTLARQPKRRKRQNPIYMGDFEEDDLQNPVKRRKYWEISQATLRKQQKTIKMLRIKTRRYENKISSLNSLLDDLKEKNKLTAQSSLILKSMVL